MSEIKRLTLVVVILITIIALLTIITPSLLGITPEWSGADDAARALIQKTGYRPWFSPVWKPPSGEIESLLFSLQSAIGAGIIGYIIGSYSRK